MARKCLICGAPSKTINMGIDACRACAVFYRRAMRSKCQLTCKYGSGECVQAGCVLECRRCRLDQMNGIFERAKLPTRPSPSSNTPCKSEPEYSESKVSLPTSVPAPESAPSPLPEPPQPLSPIRCLSNPSTSATPVLDRIRSGYNVRTRIRKSAELCMRPLDKFVHPKAIDDNSFPFIAASHNNFFALKQIEESSLFDFASIAFPDFETLSATDKWELISRGCERLMVLESVYRAAKIFPDDGRVFMSYTTTVCKDSLDVFFDGCALTVDIANAKTSLRKNIEASAAKCKAAMRSVDPTDDEFLVMMAVSFWNTVTIQWKEPAHEADFKIPSRLSEMAKNNRREIMQDLHVYYASRGVSDYAARIGELFCLLIDHERVASLLIEDIEILRLMDARHPPRY